jgi:hypothetical protein
MDEEWRSNLIDYSTDFDKANDILDDMGFTVRDAEGYRTYGNGTTIEIHFIGYSPAGVLVAEAYTDHFKEIGIKVLYHNLELSVMQNHRQGNPGFPYNIYPLTTYGGSGLYWRMGSPGSSIWIPKDAYLWYHKEMRYGPTYFTNVPAWVADGDTIFNLTENTLLLRQEGVIPDEEYAKEARKLSWYVNSQLPGMIPRDHAGMPTIWNMDLIYELPPLDDDIWTDGLGYTAEMLLIARGMIRPLVWLSVEDTPGGSISLATGEYRQGRGDEVTLTATPDEGKTFAGWELDGSIVSTETEYTVTLNDDSSIIALFETAIVNVVLTTSSTDGGTVSPSPGDHTYVKGQQATLTATPSEDYDFAGWEIDGSIVSTTTTYTLTMDDDITVEGTFEYNPITEPPPPPPYELYAIIAVLAIVVVAVLVYAMRK